MLQVLPVALSNAKVHGSSVGKEAIDTRTAQEAPEKVKKVFYPTLFFCLHAQQKLSHGISLKK